MAIAFHRSHDGILCYRWNYQDLPGALADALGEPGLNRLKKETGLRIGRPSLIPCGEYAATVIWPYPATILQMARDGNEYEEEYRTERGAEFA